MNPEQLIEFDEAAARRVVLRIGQFAGYIAADLPQPLRMAIRGDSDLLIALGCHGFNILAAAVLHPEWAAGQFQAYITDDPDMLEHLTTDAAQVVAALPVSYVSPEPAPALRLVRP